MPQFTPDTSSAANYPCGLFFSLVNQNWALWINVVTTFKHYGTDTVGAKVIQYFKLSTSSGGTNVRYRRAWPPAAKREHDFCVTDPSLTLSLTSANACPGRATAKSPPVSPSSGRYGHLQPRALRRARQHLCLLHVEREQGQVQTRQLVHVRHGLAGLLRIHARRQRTANLVLECHRQVDGGL